MEKTNWIILAAIVCVVLFGLFIGFGSSSTGLFSISDKTVTIGVLLPLSGGLANYGDEAKNAIQMATDEINANGGINGIRLVIDFQDHQCNAQVARSIFEQLTSMKGVKVLTSLACSGTALAITPLLEERGVVYVGTAVSTPALSGVSKNFFRNWALDSTEAELFAEQAQKINLKKMGVVYEETDYAKGLKIAFENKLASYGIQIVSESFLSNATDIRSQLSKLKELNLDGLFISVQTVASADLVLKQMTEIDFKPKQIFGSDYVLKTNDFIQKYEILEGTIGADFVYDDSPKYATYLEQYGQKYGYPPLYPNFSAAAYDSIYFLVEAIKEKGYNSEAIAEYLSNKSLDGVTGEVAFNELHDRANAKYTLFVVKDKKVVLLG